MFSTENQIILAACHITPTVDQHDILKTLLSCKIDLDRLILLALQESLGGFLYRNLLNADLLETLKPEQQQRLYTNYYLTIRHNLKLTHALGTILERLHQRGVPIVLMQGIALLQQIYRDIGLRPMNDMDLWVLPHDYQALVDCLHKLGFERDLLYPDTFRKREVLLDIHTHLLWAERIKARNYLLDKQQEKIFNNTVEVNIEGRKALCLSMQDQFLYLGLHALKHNLARLIWLVDIKSLVADWNTLDWKELDRRAEELGHKKTLSYILFLVDNVFNLRPPCEIRLYPESCKLSFLESRVLRRRVRGRSIPTWAQLLLMSAGKRFSERFLLFWETLFPRPEVLRQVFFNSPRDSVMQLYWRRVLQILGIVRP